MRTGVLGITIALAGLLPAAAPSAVRGAEDEIQSTWKLVSASHDGQTVAPDPGDEMHLVLRDGQYTIMHNGHSIESGTYTVDASQTPQTLDVVPAAGPERGQVVRGIVECEGETLTTCIGRPGGQRPTTFTAPPNSGQMLFVYQRVER